MRNFTKLLLPFLLQIQGKVVYNIKCMGTISKKALKVALGATAAFSLFTIISHPRSKIYKNIPRVKVKNVDVLPNLRIKRKEKIYHIHHWLYWSSLYAYLLLRKKRILKKTFLHGFIVGGILQGLAYKDRFKVIHKPQFP